VLAIAQEDSGKGGGGDGFSRLDEAPTGGVAGLAAVSWTLRRL